MKEILMAGNWKMHKNRASIEAFFQGMKHVVPGEGVSMLVCVPAPYLELAKSLATPLQIEVGCQNMHYEEEGAFTGEISPLMLVDLSIPYVILGHSERRQLFGENGMLIGKKVKAAIQHGLTPILCVGETLEERQKGEADTVVLGQLLEGLSLLPGDMMNRVIIAYEPVWAIGTGEVASPEDAEEMASIIRRELEKLVGRETARTMKILYGGSVKPDNVKSLMSMPNIDGGLVGGASLNAADYSELVKG